MTTLRHRLTSLIPTHKVIRKHLAITLLGAFATCSFWVAANAGDKVIRALNVDGQTRGYIAYFPDSLNVSQVPGAAAPVATGQQQRAGNRQRQGQFAGRQGQRAQGGQGQRRFGQGQRHGQGQRKAFGGSGGQRKQFAGAGAGGAAGAAAMAGGEVTVGNPTNRKLKVLIAFHPALGTGSFMEEHTDLHNTAGADDFIIVYPDGVKKTWNVGECCGSAEKMNINELAFFDAMLNDLNGITPIDPEVYITGYSNGALMVYYLTCNRPQQIAAAVAFAAYLPPETMQKCVSRQVPFVHLHGDTDDGSPYLGGDTPFLGYLPPIDETLGVIAARNGCNTAQTTPVSVPELDTTCSAYQGCGGNAETMLCIIPGLGHSWPGMSGKPGGKFGPARSELQGSKAVLEFFERH